MKQKFLHTFFTLRSKISILAQQLIVVFTIFSSGVVIWKYGRQYAEWLYNLLP